MGMGMATGVKIKFGLFSIHPSILVSIHHHRGHAGRRFVLNHRHYDDEPLPSTTTATWFHGRTNSILTGFGRRRRSWSVCMHSGRLLPSTRFTFLLD